MTDERQPWQDDPDAVIGRALLETDHLPGLARKGPEFRRLIAEDGWTMVRPRNGIRLFELSMLDAAAIYEGLLLLALFAAKNPDQPTPYNVLSIDALRDRVIDEGYPELSATYRGNREERRRGRKG